MRVWPEPRTVPSLFPSRCCHFRTQQQSIAGVSNETIHNSIRQKAFLPSKTLLASSLVTRRCVLPATRPFYPSTSKNEAKRYVARTLQWHEVSGRRLLTIHGHEHSRPRQGPSPLHRFQSRAAQSETPKRRINSSLWLFSRNGTNRTEIFAGHFKRCSIHQ